MKKSVNFMTARDTSDPAQISIMPEQKSTRLIITHLTA